MRRDQQQVCAPVVCIRFCGLRGDVRVSREINLRQVSPITTANNVGRTVITNNNRRRPLYVFCAFFGNTRSVCVNRFRKGKRVFRISAKSPTTHIYRIYNVISEAGWQNFFRSIRSSSQTWVFSRGRERYEIDPLGPFLDYWCSEMFGFHMLLFYINVLIKDSFKLGFYNEVINEFTKIKVRKVVFLQNLIII